MNEPSICEILKKEKEICASFAVEIQNAKVMVIVCKCLVKMKKTLNLYSKIICVCETTVHIILQYVVIIVPFY